MEFKFEYNHDLEKHVQKRQSLMENSEISELDFLRELVELQQKEIGILQYNLNVWQVRYYNLLGENNEKSKL